MPGETLAAVACALAFAAAQAYTYTPIVPIPAPVAGPALLSSLPRYNWAGAVNAADLGAYSLVACSGSNSSTSCSLASISFSMSTLASASASSVMSYAQGVVNYFAIGAVVAVIMCAAVAVTIFCRYCFCRRRCCKPASCTCLRCGAPYPTPKQTCCGCGFVPLRGSGKAALGYRACDRCGARVFIVLFILAAGALVAVGELLGNGAIAAGMLAGATRGSDALMAVLVRSVPIATTLAAALGSNVIEPFLVAVNDTVYAAADLNATYGRIQCTLAAASSLPNVSGTSLLLLAMQAGVPPLLAAAGAVQADAAAASGTQAAVVGGAGTLVTSLAAVASGLSPINASLLAAGSPAVALVAYQSQLCWPVSTPQGASAVGALADLQNITTGLPSPAALAAVSGAGAGSLGELTSGSMDGVSGDAATLVANLSAILAQLTALPNFTTTSTELGAIQAANAAASPAAAALSAALSSTQAALAALPNLTAAGLQVSAFAVTLQGLNYSSLQADVLAFNGTAQALPPFGPVLAQVGQLNGLSGVLPCLLGLASDLRAISAQVIALPPSAATVEALASDTNASLASVLAPLNQTQASIAALQRSLAAVGFSAYAAQAASASGAVGGQVASLNASALPAQLSALQDTLASLNGTFGAAQTALAVMQAAAAAYSVDPALPPGLASLQGSVAGLLPLLSRAVGPLGDYVLYSQGYCAGNMSLFCSSDGICGAQGPCTGNATSRCAQSQATACATDASCAAPGDYCLADAGRAGALAAALQALAAPNVTLQLGYLAPSAASCRGAPLLLLDSTLPANLSAAQAAVAAVALGGYAPLLASVASSAASVDLAGINASVGGAATAAAGLNLTFVAYAVQAMQGSLGQLSSDSTLASLATVAGNVQALLGLFSGALPAYLARLQPAALAQVLAVSGPAALVNEVVAVPEGVVNYLVQHAAGLLPFPAVTLLANSSYALYLDRAAGAGTAPDTTQHGSLYYAGRLFAPGSVVLAGTPGTQSLLADANGVAYAGGALCLTAECLAYTVNALNTLPLTSWAGLGLLPAGAAIPAGLSLSRLNLARLLWVPLLLVALLGVWALLATLCYRAPTCQKCPSAALAAGGVCLAPCVLLLSSAALLALIVWQDVCATGVNVGGSAIQAYGDALCTAAGGAGTLRSCLLGTAVQGVSVNVTLDIYGTYAGLVGTCSAATDSIGAAVTGLQPLAVAVPVSVVGAATGPGGLAASYGLSPALITALNTAAASAGQALSTALGAAEPVLLSCAPLNAVVKAGLAGACGDLLTPVFWFVICWYLAGWALLCLAFPAGILGRKRLPTAPWGPAFEEALAAAGGDPTAPRSRNSRGKSSAKVAPVDATQEVDAGKFSSSSPKRGKGKDKDRDKDKDGSSSRHHHRGGAVDARKKGKEKDKGKDREKDKETRGRSSAKVAPEPGSKHTSPKKASSSSSGGKEKDKDKDKKASSSKKSDSKSSGSKSRSSSPAAAAKS